ncbi:unannotated protein [freshwater metagenome]|uniref:Unannotated protein n=1 Tax=freshwater metagenome TaxID=449393 RepID=A0A6J7QMU8_9ZZZZ
MRVLLITKNSASDGLSLDALHYEAVAESVIGL